MGQFNNIQPHILKQNKEGTERIYYILDTTQCNKQAFMHASEIQLTQNPSEW